LCASSDPNHGVFLAPPFRHEALRRAIEDEAALRARGRGAA